MTLQISSEGNYMWEKENSCKNKERHPNWKAPSRERHLLYVYVVRNCLRITKPSGFNALSIELTGKCTQNSVTGLSD